MGICQFDLTYGGNHYRNLKKLKGTQWLEDDGEPKAGVALETSCNREVGDGEGRK